MQQDGDDDMVGIFTFKVQNLGKYWFKKKKLLHLWDQVCARRVADTASMCG